MEFYRCEHCGNIVAFLNKSGVPVVCCGEKMKLLEPGVVEAAVEKHLPVVAVNGRSVTVSVGSVAHPMTEEPLIQFVVLVTDKGYQVAQLTAADEPKASFVLAEGAKALKVYEYCNLHGLWVKEL